MMFVNPIDEWIKTEKEDLHKIIRVKRNNLTKLTIEKEEELKLLPITETFKLNVYRSWLDTIDYLLDKGE